MSVLKKHTDQKQTDKVDFKIIFALANICQFQNPKLTSLASEFM